MLPPGDARHVDDAGLYFRWLCDTGSFTPSRTAYLGRTTEDLRSAASIGWLTVAFNHDADAEADLYIEQFDQLLKVLQAGNQQMLVAG